LSNHEIKDRFRGFLPIVIDVETAGFNQKTVEFLIKPFEGANIEQAALDFTGIDPFAPDRQHMPEEEALNQMFAKVRKELKSVNCKRAILVGHNAAFDHGFLNAAIERVHIKRNPFHPFSSFDTASLAGLVYGQTVLAKACEAASIPFSNAEAHSAKYDTEKTAELFCEMVNRLKRLGGWPLIENEAEDDMAAIFHSGK